MKRWPYFVPLALLLCVSSAFSAWFSNISDVLGANEMVFNVFDSVVKEKRLDDEAIEQINVELAEKRANLPDSLTVLINELEYIEAELQEVQASRSAYKGLLQRINQFVDIDPAKLSSIDDFFESTSKNSYKISRIGAAYFDRLLRLEKLFRMNVPELRKLDTFMSAADIGSSELGAIRSLIQSAIEGTASEMERERSRLNTLVENHESIESELFGYRKALKNRIREIEQRASLSSNLYLIISIIGGLSILTIAVIKIFPDDVVREWVESGQVIQFVTVMILLSVIMALGLANLLDGQTLGALLGGIGGYVLSQGVGRSAARSAMKEIEQNARRSSSAQSEGSGN